MSHRNFFKKTTFAGRIVRISALSSAFTMGMVFAQPAGVPAGPNVACAAGPGSAADTVVAAPDTAGFRPIFNGTDLTGWWESCQSTHSDADKVNGGFWIVDQTQKALFSNQTTGGAGSILMTKKTYTNYELIMDLWLDFGNDAGIFQRTSAAGRCYQTVLDYISAGSVGGVWGEGGYAPSTLDIRPFRMGNNENTITDRSGWAFTGNWADVWNAEGWNQIRTEVFGNPPRVRTYLRKLGAANWTPILDHTSTVSDQPSGYIGIQIHKGQDRWSGRAGNWYRNINVRYLNATGTPIPQGPGVGVTSPTKSEIAKFKSVSGSLVGSADLDYTLTFRDLHGRSLGSFQGKSGAFSHPLPGKANGLVLAEFRTAKGIQSQKVAALAGY